MTTHSRPSATVAQAPACIVDVTGHFGCTGIVAPNALDTGAFNVWSNTFPADELPPAGGEVRVHGLPFAFPATDAAGHDHLRCARQLIEVPAGRYDWIHILAAAERHTEDQVLLSYVDGTIDPEWLRVSDFWPETASRFGESAAFTCSALQYPRHIQHNMPPTIWRQRIAVPRESDLAGIRLPDNPAIHIFAMTLQSAPRITVDGATERAA